MILGEVEETVTSIEIDEETYEELYKVIILLNNIYLVNKLNFFLIFFQPTKRSIPMLFVRGDGVILVSPLIRNNS